MNWISCFSEEFKYAITAPITGHLLACVLLCLFVYLFLLINDLFYVVLFNFNIPVQFIVWNNEYT